MSNWQEIKNVVVLGLGVTGLSVVSHLARLKAQGIADLSIKVNDSRANPPSLENLQEAYPDLPLHTGEWQEDWLLDADLIVVNPGIALATPILQAAKKAGVKLVGDIELFAWEMERRRQKNPEQTAKVVAITGSNGKSTVTDLTGVLANASGLNAAIGGNIGVPALDLLQQDKDLYVLELSSFQLETTDSLFLNAAAFLNFTEDHMDRYSNKLEEYLAAKQRIFKHAKVAVVNRDDLATYPDPSLYPKESIEILSFGSDEAELGKIHFQDKEYLSYNQQNLIATSRLALVGAHNHSNALVALALVKSVGVDIIENPALYDALKAYQGLSHRCQLVKEQDGVRWINDSKATNVASTEAALGNLTLEGRLHLLMGGLGKGADFSPLKPLLAQYDLALYCFGQDGEKLIDLHPSGCLYQTMDQAIAEIKQNAQAGDLVLLSPACASLDQYPNFMARGDAFIALCQSSASAK